MAVIETSTEQDALDLASELIDATRDLRAVIIGREPYVAAQLKRHFAERPHAAHGERAEVELSIQRAHDALIADTVFRVEHRRRALLSIIEEGAEAARRAPDAIVESGGNVKDVEATRLRLAAELPGAPPSLWASRYEEALRTLTGSRSAPGWPGAMATVQRIEEDLAAGRGPTRPDPRETREVNALVTLNRQVAAAQAAREPSWVTTARDVAHEALRATGLTRIQGRRNADGLTELRTRYPRLEAERHRRFITFGRAA